MRFRRRTAAIITPEERERRGFPWGKVVYFGILGAIVIGFGVWGFSKVFYIKGRGVLEADSIKVESKLNARIIEIKPGVNDRVTEGEPVVFLDKSGLKAQITSKETDVGRKNILSRNELVKAESELKLAEQEKRNQEELVNGLRGEYDRAKRLLALEAITRPQFLEIEGAFGQAEANLSVLSTAAAVATTTYETHKKEHDYYHELVQADRKEHQGLLQETELLAPISGVVTKIYKQVGEMALRGQPIIGIADPSKIFVKTYFDPADEGKIYVGKRVTVIFANGDKYLGEIRAVYPASHKLPLMYRKYYGPAETPIVSEVDLLAEEPPSQTLGTTTIVRFRRPWF